MVYTGLVDETTLEGPSMGTNKKEMVFAFRVLTTSLILRRYVNAPMVEGSPYREDVVLEYPKEELDFIRNLRLPNLAEEGAVIDHGPSTLGDVVIDIFT